MEDKREEDEPDRQTAGQGSERASSRGRRDLVADKVSWVGPI